MGSVGCEVTENLGFQDDFCDGQALAVARHDFVASFKTHAFQGRVGKGVVTHLVGGVVEHLHRAGGNIDD